MMARALVLLIRLYQLTLSRLLYALFGPVCRFTPSCSAYALACVQSHGALRGSLLSIKRVGKCHPFHPGGYDPPPPRNPPAAEPTAPNTAESVAADSARAATSVSHDVSS